MEVETKTITNSTDTLTDGVISTIAYEKEPEVTPGDLEVEMAKEPAKLPTIVTNLDICFMLDCTGSMQSYIDRSRNKIKDIIEEVKQQYPESEIQVGIVGYRDVQDTKRFEILPFTSNIHSAKDFLDAIRADGGGDTPEDVNGAFQETLNNMEWQGQAKMIVHIADAPCHGKDFHSCWSDNHPSGYKDDVAWEVLFKKIIDQRIDYLFLKIESETDKMFTKFKEIAEGLGATANGVLFKQEPISIADATKTAPVVTVSTAPSLFTRVAHVEKKKRASRKEAAKKEKKETTKTKKTRETRSKSRKESVSRSRSKSVKTTKKEKASRKKVEKEEEVSSDWNAPTHWTRSKYQEYLEHGGKEQKKDGYWSIPQTDATEIKTTRRRSSKKSTTRKPSVSKERSEKRDKKRTEKSTRRKASVSKDKERSAERTKKKNSTRSKSKKGGMAVEDTLPKRAFVAPKSKILTKAPAPVMPTSFVGMSAMDEQEYFAKLLSKEMMESIHRKKDAVK